MSKPSRKRRNVLDWAMRDSLRNHGLSMGVRHSKDCACNLCKAGSQVVTGSANLPTFNSQLARSLCWHCHRTQAACTCPGPWLSMYDRARPEERTCTCGHDELKHDEEGDCQELVDGQPCDCDRFRSVWNANEADYERRYSVA